MRKRLSELLVIQAKKDPNIIVLTGDHGYALFDDLKLNCPKQFLNCGVAEQGMIGIAAGLALQGFKPIVYGLASFIPIRVLEQIKLDICYPSLPILLLGDGAGLVYSTLGASHQCNEDIACLRPLPNISIYSPCDGVELEDCFTEALSKKAPSYIRLGKSDRPVMAPKVVGNTEPWTTHDAIGSSTCIVSHGSMLSQATAAAKLHSLRCFSVPKIKPLDRELVSRLLRYRHVIVIEEHSKHGGLFSALAEELSQITGSPRLTPLTLEDRFTHKCGTYQYALSEHKLSDAQLQKRVDVLLG